MAELRKRNSGISKETPEVLEKLINEDIHANEKNIVRNDDKSGINSYWLTRIVYLRAMGTVYFVAFLVALHQNRALIGTKGMSCRINYFK